MGILDVPALTAHGEPQPGYYRNENDISFCIVTEVLAARLTRWQLVLEDFYRSSATSGIIWLARGAPKRWFQSGQGFSVEKAPTRFGRLSFTVSSDKSGLTYRVTAPDGAPTKLRWNLQWPAESEDVSCSGCTIVEKSDGIISVVANDGVFTVGHASDASEVW